MKKIAKLIAASMLSAMIMAMAFGSNDVYAKNATATHTVTFLYGGKISIQQVPHGINSPIPTDINVDGYNFLGWVGDVTKVTEDRIILGAYKKKEPVETWTVHRSEIVPNSSFPVSIYGLNVEKQDPTVKFNNNITATAPEWWKELNLPKGVPGVTCAVHWVNGSTGELWKTDVVPYGYTCPDPGNPCIAGYEFIGWEGSWENITEDRVIKAWYFKK